MTAQSQLQSRQWTRKQAALLAVACLLAGVGGGWWIGGFKHPAASVSAAASDVPPRAAGRAAAPPETAPAQLKAAADEQAAPLIDRLKSEPANPAVLTELGNIYYDAQEYPLAAGYYSRVLKARPDDAAVRTDMATAYWYMGQADHAIAEFNKALSYAPDNPNTLFNRGLVKWRANKDAAGALADWKRLLATDPAYDEKDKVQQMIAEVEAQQAPASAARTQ